MLESRLALLVEQMGEVADEKREDQGWLLQSKARTQHI